MERKQKKAIRRNIAITVQFASYLIHEDFGGNLDNRILEIFRIIVKDAGFASKYGITDVIYATQLLMEKQH